MPGPSRRRRPSTRIPTATAGSSASASATRRRSARCSTRPPTSSSSPSSRHTTVTHPYLSLTDADRDAMLDAVGVDSVEELFRDIPAAVRFGRELDLEPALSEQEL